MDFDFNELFLGEHRVQNFTIYNLSESSQNSAFSRLAKYTVKFKPFGADSLPNSHCTVLVKNIVKNLKKV